VSDDTHLRFLARSLEPNRWGGDAPLPELDVEGALASVLARAGELEQPEAAELLSLPLEPAAAPARRMGRWTRAVAAALLMVGGLAPWLASQQGPETHDSRGSEGVLAVSTAAVVYSQHSGSQAQNG